MLTGNPQIKVFLQHHACTFFITSASSSTQPLSTYLPRRSKRSPPSYSGSPTVCKTIAIVSSMISHHSVQMVCHQSVQKARTGVNGDDDAKLGHIFLCLLFRLVKPEGMCAMCVSWLHM